jgi:hypothetical protein
MVVKGNADVSGLGAHYRDALARFGGLLLPKTRRAPHLESLLGVDDARLGDQLIFALWVVGIRNAAIDRANRGALLLIEEPDALRALLGDDVIDVRGNRGMLVAVVLPLCPAFVNGRVGALRLACSAVDAFFRDHRGHRGSSEGQLNAVATGNMSAANGKVGKSMRDGGLGIEQSCRDLVGYVKKGTRSGMPGLVDHEGATPIHARPQLTLDRDRAEEA